MCRGFRYRWVCFWEFRREAWVGDDKFGGRGSVVGNERFG